MKNLITQLATFCLLALPLFPVHAAFDPATVPADAKWVLHVDFNTLRESPVGQEIIAQAEKNAVIPVGANIQIDVKKVLATLGSATAYGTTFSKDPKEIDGTLILQGTDELRKIAEGVAVQFSISNPELVTEVKDLPFSAYSIKGEVTVAFPKEPIILVSRSRQQLLNALDLYRGKGPSAARGPSSLKNLIPQTKTIFVLAASEVPNTDGLFPENAPQARILKMASSASVAIGNNNKLTTASIQLAATDEEMADRLLKIVQGFGAMLSLAQSDDKQIAEFLQSLKTERNGKIIMINLSYPSDGLVKMIREMAQNEQHNRSNGEHASDSKPAVPGKILDTWTADKETGHNTIAPESLLYHTIGNVVLKNGSTIILTGQRDEGENARIDCIDITSPGIDQALHFEAENMKLSHYHVEKSPFASGGKDIILSNHPVGDARFEFPGVDGTYTLKIRYVDENDGKATFTVSIQDPEPAENNDDEAPEPPAAPAVPPTRPAPAK
jgi:hypothetical protein